MSDAHGVTCPSLVAPCAQDQEPAFNRLTQLAAAMFNVPICLVSFVADESQWFKCVETRHLSAAGSACSRPCAPPRLARSRVGLDAEGTGRDVAFCSYTTLREQEGCFVVLDAHSDIRFAANPLVTGPPHIAFYAGAPIYHPSSPYKVGSFCIIGKEPRASFDEAQQHNLQLFANHISHELVMRATLSSLMCAAS